MLKSKLLTLFIAFALVITIGGVYATWVYPSANLEAITPQSANVVATINDASVDTGTTPGTLAITDNTLAYHIKNAGDYKTAIETPITGGVTIKYTPSEGSEYTLVNLICRIQIVAQQYEGNNIFKIGNTEAIDGVLTLKKSGVGSGADAWTITDADIQLALTQLAGEAEPGFVLDTITKHHDFKAALTGTSIALDFSVDTSTPKN